MDTTFQLPIANGATVVPLFEGSTGSFEIYLRAPNPPTAGSLLIEGLPFGGTSYVTIGGASALPLTGLANGNRLAAGDFGHFVALRFTLSGVVGGSGVIVGSAGPVVQTTWPDGVLVGLRALNVQSYTESNTKLGTQFYFQIQIPTVTAGGAVSIGFTTGALPVLVKDRQMTAFGSLVTLQLFKAPTFTGGTAIAVQNYNDINPVATTVTIAKGVTVSNSGTPWGDPVRVFGSSSTAQRTSSGLAPGGDRVLKPNSKYLITISNPDNADAQVDYYLSWFEGQPDMPRA